jgi:hypothetical protein
LKIRVNASVVPEITAVSKPKSKPPSAATIVLLSNVPLIFIFSPVIKACLHRIITSFCRTVRIRRRLFVLSNGGCKTKA